MAAEIHVVSPERIAMEMRRLLSDQSRAVGVRLMLETKLAPELLPEIVPHDDAQQRRLDATLDLLARLGGECGFPLALGRRCCTVGRCARGCGGVPTLETLE